MIIPVLEGFGRQTMRRAVRMPKILARRLYGPPPTNDRGMPLDEQVHIFLNLMEATGQGGIHELELAAARKVYRLSCRVFDRPGPMLESVTNHTASGPYGDIPVRVYRPTSVAQDRLLQKNLLKDNRRPALVYFHGGGFVIGGVDTHDGLCRTLAERTESVVISVDYRLAPEHCFPAAIDECVAAYQWVESHADRFSIDPDRIAVGGDSAGANLATVTCQQLVSDGLSAPARQLLIYPSTDNRGGYESQEHFEDGYFLTGPMLHWFSSSYLDGRQDLNSDPRVSPILFDDLHSLPPAFVITAGFDPLRDEGEAYAQRLADAGVDTTTRCFAGLIHGFITMGGLFDAAEQAIWDICAEFRRSIA
jgi:acetyl esterase